MALRLVADFDLRKDVLPWLRAASAAAAPGGGGPGAGGARLGGVGGGGRRRRSRLGTRSRSYLEGSGLGQGGGRRPDGGSLCPLPRLVPKARASLFESGLCHCHPATGVKIGGQPPGRISAELHCFFLRALQLWAYWLPIVNHLQQKAWGH